VQFLATHLGCEPAQAGRHGAGHVGAGRCPVAAFHHAIFTRRFRLVAWMPLAPSPAAAGPRGADTSFAPGDLGQTAQVKARPQWRRPRRHARRRHCRSADVRFVQGSEVPLLAAAKVNEAMARACADRHPRQLPGRWNGRGRPPFHVAVALRESPGGR
jgi:hypothetical protein